MSETTQKPEVTEKPAPTIQQLLAELNQWCAQRGVVIGPGARGARTG